MVLFADGEYVTKLNYEFCLFDDWFETILKLPNKSEKILTFQNTYIFYIPVQDRNTFPSEIKEITPP